MPDELSNATRDRLARSRSALIGGWPGHGDVSSSPFIQSIDVVRPPLPVAMASRLTGALQQKAAAALKDIDWLTVSRSAAHRWWQRHPANAVGQLARPLLQNYARQQPGKLLAIAAVTGAAAVLIRPWRLLSAATLIAGLLKTSDVAGLVTSLMDKSTTPRKES